MHIKPLAQGVEHMENTFKISHSSPGSIRLEFSTPQTPFRAPRDVCLHIYVAKTAEDVDRWLEEHKPTVLGFDIEWKPFFDKAKPNKASLMQLSSNDHVLLVQLFNIDISPGLRNVLEDHLVKKVGVGILADAIKMQNDWGVIVNGVVDIGKGGMSLAKVAEATIQIKLSKKKKICLSNWEDKRLSRAQIIYAALDAWVASESYAATSLLRI